MDHKLWYKKELNHHNPAPTIVNELIDVFKTREQAATEVTYQQLETGVIPPECRGSAEKMTMSTGQVSISEYP